jgi:hypothetical protein
LQHFVWTCVQGYSTAVCSEISLWLGTDLSADQLLRVILHHIPAHIAEPDSSAGAAQLHRGGGHPFTARRSEHKVHNVQVRGSSQLFHFWLPLERIFLMGNSWNCYVLTLLLLFFHQEISGHDAGGRSGIHHGTRLA